MIMDRVRGWLRQLRVLGRKAAVEAELDEEMAFHVAMETERRVRSGMDPAEARREALREFRGVDRYKEEVRDARWVRLIEDLAADVRLALRAVGRKPGFAAAVIVTLGLGIGATTAIFGVVDALFLRHPAGVAAADEVVRLYIVRDEGRVTTPDGGPGSYVDYESVRRGVGGFSAVTAFNYARPMDLGRGPEASQVRGQAADAGFLPFLGVPAAVGRLLLPADELDGAHPVAVLSHGFARRRFGGPEEPIGTVLELNGEPRTVVGVTAPGFTGLDPEPVDVWIPMAPGPWRTHASMAGLNILGRRHPGATEETLIAESESALARAAEAEPGLDQTPGVLLGTLVPAGGPNRSPAADLALWLLAVSGAVLVIACANVANMLLARGATRRRETAVRLSLGAGRGRVMRHYLAESVILALLGGAAGGGVALSGSWLVRQFPLPPGAGQIDARMLLVAMALALGTGLIFGLVPAMSAGRTDPVEGLKDNAAGGHPSRGRMRRALITVQVALSAILLVGAGLFVRSLDRVHHVDAGLDPYRLLSVSVDLRQAGYGLEEREIFYQDALARVARVPGVESVAMSHFPPFSGSAFGVEVRVMGRETPAVEDKPLVNWVGPDYFRTIGTTIVRGRPIGEGDAAGEPVAVLSEALADRLETVGEVLGMCLNVRVGEWQDACTRVVGVAEDQRRSYLGEPPLTVWLERARSPAELSWGGPTLLVRTTGPAAPLTAPVRSALQAVRADLPFVSVDPVSELVRPEILPYRLGATLFSLFGILAAVLAGVGLYGVLSYFVAERRPELGIRRSLGATDRQTVGLVVRQGLVPIALGLGAGLVVAFAASRLIEALLFGVGARDPLAFGVVPAFLLVVGLIASYLPARRAARVHPMAALRAE